MNKIEDLQTRIQDVIDRKVLPALRMDGVTIEVVGVDRGVLQVRLQGACTSCPSSIRAVIMGIEEELRRHVPEVDYLEVLPGE
jgi:Fe-S cluster biogenesis protein NfuA